VAVIDPTSWNTALAAVALGVGLVFLALAVTRAGQRAAHLVHAAMGFAMAGMSSPWGDPVPVVAGALGFALAGAGCTAQAVQAGRSGYREPSHLAVACAAMVFMYVHPGHGDGSHAVGAASVVALGLAAYFACRTWSCAVAAGVGTCPAPAASSVLTRTRSPSSVAARAQVAMGALMTVMFLGVL